VTIKRKRNRGWRTSAPEKLAVAHDALLPLRPDTGERWFIRDNGRSWADDAGGSLEAEVSSTLQGAVLAHASAMKGVARKVGKAAPTSKTHAVVEKYEAAKENFVRVGRGELMHAPFSVKRILDIGHTAQQYKIALPSSAAAFARWLGRRAKD
jgi:hypothetical protein